MTSICFRPAPSRLPPLPFFCSSTLVYADSAVGVLLEISRFHDCFWWASLKTGTNCFSQSTRIFAGPLKQIGGPNDSYFHLSSRRQLHSGDLLNLANTVASPLAPATISICCKECLSNWMRSGLEYTNAKPVTAPPENQATITWIHVRSDDIIAS